MVINSDKFMVGVVKKTREIDFHIPVLSESVVNGLNIRDGLVYVDATVGGAGHSSLIAHELGNNGILICLDVDDMALDRASTVLKPYQNVFIRKSNFLNFASVLDDLGIKSINGGILLDLGVSFYQLTSQQRGFSFLNDSNLDMRMNQDLQISAYDLVNDLSEDELAEIFYKYGEEKYSRRIAAVIIEKRVIKPIQTTVELAELVAGNVPYSRKSKVHPATRVFQALRIAVNDELNVLSSTLEKLLDSTVAGARIAVITFHSLEDRIVKQFFKFWSLECVCAPKLIECRCNHLKKLDIITKKPIVATQEELILNPSARSAKLRIAERL